MQGIYFKKRMARMRIQQNNDSLSHEGGHTMNNIDTAAMRARCEAATPGPWNYIKAYGEYVRDNDGRNISLNYRTEDANFVTHARSDLPDLLNAYEALEAENARLREEAQWIPVMPETMPKKYGKYEAYDSGTKEVLICSYSSKYGVFLAKNHIITHWRPLTTPPDATPPAYEAPMNELLGVIPMDPADKEE
jgi:hypothetical protein